MFFLFKKAHGKWESVSVIDVNEKFCETLITFSCNISRNISLETYVLSNRLNVFRLIKPIRSLETVNSRDMFYANAVNFEVSDFFSSFQTNITWKILIPTTRMGQVGKWQKHLQMSPKLYGRLEGKLSSL